MPARLIGQPTMHAQAWVGVVPVGPAGQALNSSYANRDSQSYKEDLGNAIVNFARMVPDGVLVFFPSYAVLRGCIDAWKAGYGSGQSWGSSIWERITAHKQPVIEPQVWYPPLPPHFPSLSPHARLAASRLPACVAFLPKGPPPCGPRPETPQCQLFMCGAGAAVHSGAWPHVHSQLAGFIMMPQPRA